MPALERVTVRNFRGIAHCDVRLGPLACLVGRNGSGKSSLLDALRFVRDALTGSLDDALHARGGISEVRRRSTGHPHHVGISLELALGDGTKAVYGFEIGATGGGGYEVTTERCAIDGDGRDDDDGHASGGDFYVTRNGRPESHGEFAFPATSPDRLALTALSGMAAFRPVFDHLAGMRFYRPDPELMRALHPPREGGALGPACANVASVVGRMERHAPDAMRAVETYLCEIVPTIRSVARERIGHVETLAFREGTADAEHPWRFLAQNMSDGTLRALGVLVALFQRDGEARPSLVGIEEPESGLHPAAGATLRDALRRASADVQTMITSHGPDLLDDPDLDAMSLLAVSAADGATRIAPVDEVSRDAMRRHLFTAGELLRLDRLAPDADAAGERPEQQLDLFDGASG